MRVNVNDVVVEGTPSEVAELLGLLQKAKRRSPTVIAQAVRLQEAVAAANLKKPTPATPRVQRRAATDRRDEVLQLVVKALRGSANPISAKQLSPKVGGVKANVIGRMIQIGLTRKDPLVSGLRVHRDAHGRAQGYTLGTKKTRT